MARPGVTYNEVYQAASHLIGQGKNPTIQEVRLLIGSGSSTTIANHLKQWRDEQKGTSLLAAKENIPDELVALMKGLWERVIELSEIKVGEIEQKYSARVGELELEVEKYKTNNTRWQKLFGEWQEANKKAETSIADLTTALTALENANRELLIQHQVDAQQLQEKEERIAELNRLHHQAQNNLEHYRESMREERLLEQQRFEQQRQELQLEMKGLREQERELRERLSGIQLEYQALQARYSMLEKSYVEMGSQLDKTKQELDTSDLHARKLQEQNLNIIEECEEQLTGARTALLDMYEMFLNASFGVSIL